MPDALKFSKSELLGLLSAAAADAPPLGADDDRLRGRLYELYNQRLISGRSVSLDKILAGGPADRRAPVPVFSTADRGWRLVAVFAVPPARDPPAEMAWHDLLQRYGVEYVPVPAELVRVNYLYSSDFRVRSRRAIYVPLRMSFKPYPQPPARGWPIRLPAPSRKADPDATG